MGSIAAFGLALTILFFTLGFGARRFTVTPGLLGLRTTRDLRDQISAATEPEAMYLGRTYAFVDLTVTHFIINQI